MEDNRSDYDPYAPSTSPKLKVVTEEDLVRYTDGSIKEILEAVGDDKDKIKAALKEEEAKPEPRSTLVDKLKKLAE